MGCLEAAGEAQQRTAVATAVQSMEAEAEVPMEGLEAGVKKREGQLLLGAAAWVQPVQLVGAASVAGRQQVKGAGSAAGW